MQLKLVAPDPTEFVSGGNIYNQSLMQAVINSGSLIERISSPEDNHTGTRHIIDSIYFGTLTNIPSGSISLLHHLPSLYPGPSSRFTAVEKPLLDQFEAHIVTSRFMEQFMIDHGYHPDRVLCLEPVGPALNRRQVAPAEKVNAIMLNNVVPRKGILELLKAIAHLKIMPVYRLTIVGDLKGDDSYANQCLDLVRNDHVLSRAITFTGSQDEASVRRLMQKSNLFISASVMETFGMSIQEASLTGIPLLVLTGGNAQNHVTPAENGFVETTHMDLAKRLELLISRPNDFKHLQEKSMQYSHGYAASWKTHVATLQEFVLSLDKLA